MQIDYYFPTVVATGNIPDFLMVLKEIKDKTDLKGNFLESDVFNDNVFSTNKKVFSLIKELNLVKTKNVIDSLFQQYKQYIPVFKDRDMVLSNNWLNVTGPGGFQDMHTHQVDELVGCFYLKVPENSGVIELAPLVELASTHPRKVITPFTGMYAFFPGNVLHRVTYNKSSLQRISFAFNYKIKHALV